MPQHHTKHVYAEGGVGHPDHSLGASKLKTKARKQLFASIQGNYPTPKSQLSVSLLKQELEHRKQMRLNREEKLSRGSPSNGRVQTEPS